MAGYVVRRLSMMIPTLLVISVIVFAIIELPPGDYLDSYVAELESRGETGDEKEIAFLRDQYGFGEPLMQRYVRWVGGMLHGEFGYSFEYRLPVNAVIGGLAGYYGGWIDTVVQRVIEILRSFPEIPLWMALAAILPVTCSPLLIYFGITAILALLDWTGLARAVRSKLLSLREEDC